MSINLSKRAVCLIAAAALVLSPVAPALAAETDGLEAAILLVKGLADVPESMEDFNYHIFEDEARDYAVYNLNWSDGGERGAVNAEVANGKLTSLYRNYLGEAQTGLGSVSRETARRTAGDFLAAVDPALAAKMEATQDPRFADTARHSFDYVMKEKGILVDFVTAHVGVDKHTGEIVAYSWNGVADPPVLPTGASAISEAAAEKAFLAADGIRLEYRAWYDRESKKRTLKSVYALKDAYLAIDAKTGETVDISGLIAYKTSNAEAAADGAGGGAPQLTAAELASLSDLGGLLTKEQARAAVVRIFPEIGSLKLHSASVNRDYADEARYMWSLNFTQSASNDSGGAYASLDARTGELLSWYDYTDRPVVVSPVSSGVLESAAAPPPVSQDKALETARAFIEKNVSAEKRAHLVENADQIDEYNAIKTPISGYIFQFDRYENDILFQNNGITIYADATTGKITQYNCAWFENVDIPDTEVFDERGGREPDTAFGIYDARSDFGLKYAKLYDEAQEKEVIALVWHWNAENSIDYLIDATSFGVLGTDGKSYREAFAAAYGDIAGHWAESVIFQLVENGYYTEGADFKPNAQITQEGFLRYLYAPEQRYYSDADAFYRMLADRGVVKAGERDEAAALTRYDAAKFAVRYLGQQRIAEHPEVFVNLYKDELSAEYRGYAAVAHALSIMRGDAAGNFGGARILTRAEAATVIFHILEVQ